MVVKEEPNNLKCSSELNDLQKELVLPNDTSNSVNEGEIITGLEDISDGLGEDSKNAKILDSAGSDTGEIDEDEGSIKGQERYSGSEAGEINQDESSIKEEKLSASEAGEIDKEESCDVEEGEISEIVEKKTVCRFFLRGSCYYGPQCQFLHVSDKVYKMFDHQTMSNGSKNTIVPCFSPPVSQDPVGVSSFWENGLLTAKAMIQDSIKKRNEDKEFENKRLYISPDIPRSKVVYSREKELESKCRTSDIKAIRVEPVKDLKDTHVRQKEKLSTLIKGNSKSDYKWVDPWMRSNKKDSKKQTSERKRKKRRSSISSSSSLDNDNIDRHSKPALKEKFDRKSSSRNSCCRSYSRSRSRSSSRTRYSYSAHNHSRKNSPSHRKPKRSKMRSSSLEKWFKKEVSTARHSRSPSCTSVDSFRSYESSMTISSISCSPSSFSSSSSTNEPVLNLTKRDKKSQGSKADDSFHQRQRLTKSSIENIQTYIRDVKQKNLNQKIVSPKYTQETVPEAKSSVKPVIKLPPKKKNPAVMELLRYTNIKPKASNSVINQTSIQPASKFQDLDSSSSDCKGFVSSDPRRNITLNLQTSKVLKQKISEVQTKQSEISSKEIISKKESLLKQLRLVEEAIARKKNSY